MGDLVTPEFEVCWLHGSTALSEIENRLYEDIILIHSIPLKSVFSDLGRTGGMDRVVGFGARIDAILISWEATLAPQIGRMKSLIPPEVPVIALDDGSQPDLFVLAKTYWADDVLPSLPSLSELKATILSHRRSLLALADFGKQARGQRATLLDHGSIVMDTRQHMLTVKGRPVRLSVLQFELLELLMSNPGDLMTRDAIREKVWGMDYETTSNPVDVFVHHIRNALKPHGLSDCIKTVRGRGYRFVPPIKV